MVAPGLAAMAMAVAGGGCGDPAADRAVDAAVALDAGAPARTRAPAQASAADLTRITRGATTMVRSGDDWRRALFLCDGTNRPAAHALTIPEDGRAALVSLAGRPPVASLRALDVGLSEPGSGQLYLPLGGDDGAVGHVRATNPELVDDATLPTAMALTLDGVETRCRWQPQARFLGVTATRAILITGPDDGPFVYRAFERGSPDTLIPVDEGRTNRATLTVTRGARSGDGWTFATGGTSYRVAASTTAEKPGAVVSIRRDGRVLLAEQFLAYSVAADAASRSRPIDPTE